MLEMTSYKNLPPIASKILWAKIMENKIQNTLQQMNIFLGNENMHERNFEARVAQQECEDLLNKLNPRNYVLSWVKHWKDELMLNNDRFTSYVLLIKNNDALGIDDSNKNTTSSTCYNLQVNFKSFVVYNVLFMENLKCLIHPLLPLRKNHF